MQTMSKPENRTLAVLACVPVAWWSVTMATHGWPQDEVWPWALALAWLIGGSRPFFLRRVYGFTCGGLAVVVAAGLGLARWGRQ